MKKNILIFGICAIFLACTASAQSKSHKVAFSGADKKVVIYNASNTLKVQGYSGTEVVIESDNSGANYPDEANGLRVVSAGSAIDNTGTGANTEVEGNTLKVRIPRSKYFGNFTVKIPKGVSVSMKENGNSYGKWFVEGLDSEVEVQTTYSTLSIKDVSGPIIARCGYGKVTVEYSKLNPSKPHSISSSGAVDITLPSDTKANLKVRTYYGDLFTDFDIAPLKKVTEVAKEGEGKTVRESVASTVAGQPATASLPSRGVATRNIEGEALLGKDAQTVTSRPATVNGNVYYPSNDNDCDCDASGQINGAINGGGPTISIRSDQGNVYIRKKK